MGSGSSKKASPTILRGFRKEISHIDIPVKTAQSHNELNLKTINSLTESVENDTDKGLPLTTTEVKEIPESNAEVKEASRNNAEVKETPEKNAEVNKTSKHNADTKGTDENCENTDFVRTIYGNCSSRWPIRCYGKTNFSVNGYHGGCTGLYFISNEYSGKSGENNAELKLLRCGFDCNHVHMKSIATCHAGHFGASNSHYVDEDGMFIGDCLFGHNHLMILSNDGRYGNLRNGVCLELISDSDPLVLPLNVNGNRHQRGCGLTLILCSSQEESDFNSSLYMIRSGLKDNYFKAKVLSGEDKFKFGNTDDGQLTVTGPIGSRFGLFHNRDNLAPGSSHTYVGQSQCTDGTDEFTLIENVEVHSTVVILCSNSNGTEDSTASSIYHISISNGQLINCKEISGSYGPTYETSDLWKFECIRGRLTVKGPEGPCKYGLMSNIKATRTDLLQSDNQNECLSTGESLKTNGKITVTDESIKGEINKPSEICIMLDHEVIHTISQNEVGENYNKWTFTYSWKPEERFLGYHTIRVFAIRKHTKTKEDVFLELSGSPYHQTRQKPGVIYALNCGGPAYQDLNDIVYASEHKLFVNFDPGYMKGNQSKAGGGVKTTAIMPATIMRTHDGFLYAVTKATHGEDEHDRTFTYTIDNLPNGSFKLRVHLINKFLPKNIKCNGNDISKILLEKIKTTIKQADPSNPAGYCVDIDVDITDNTLVLHGRSTDIKHADHIAAFALLDKNYKDNVKDKDQLKSDNEMKQKLADTVLPIPTSATRKEMTIVGWSQNLLQNASGESRDLKHWNTSGDFKIDEGGYDTDCKFVTSHMWCKKYQEINLLDTFTAEYLDTAPDIQVREMYKEGSCGGGYYCLTVQLLSEDGKVLQENTTGELGRLYTNGKWIEASFIFSNYGPGVRIVSFESKGKDDKYWAGYFGAFMSGAQVRVRRESNPAEDDSFTDISQDIGAIKKSIDSLATKVIVDNQDLLKSLQEDEHIPLDKEFEKQTAVSIEPTAKWKPGRKHVSRKKREIRVFVSSTFRDFTREREEVIKKAFRKINRYCADRDVFFTYVDLRWGITSEQTDDGKTIAICLQEIDRCRPYFICLMGDRFGWCQKADKLDTLLNKSFDYAIENCQNTDWLDKYRFGTSVTQLEVLHGVLNHPEADKNKCFFYLRDPPPKEDFTEDEYKRLMSESEWHHEQQEILKSKVKQQSHVKITSFKTATEVSDMIKKDLEECIEKDFPAGTQLTKLEQQREAHTAFAAARCRVYIGSQDYFKQIHTHREQNINQPFVILGESGCGKSALVANWTKQVEDTEKDSFVFVHFIGSSADSADYIKLIRRLFEEMKEFFQFNMQIPSSDFILIHELEKWLRMAGSLTKVVIVLDALNQMDDGSGPDDGAEHDLLWIPKTLPPNVFILLSTLPGRSMSACIKAGWPNMKIQPLQDSQKLQIIDDYLQGIYGKTLNKEQKEMIISVKQTSNPLYLKSLLDEVRMYGSFRTLTSKIQEYLSAEDPQDLFAKILERLEDDFEKGTNERKHLVRDATTALWCANRGMSESELVELLQVPSAIWSPFYLSLYENLVNRNGLLNFFHDHLRKAVEKKYLATPDEKRIGYLKLADFHSKKETSNRTVEELPFLLTRAGELERLKSTITNLDVFYRLSGNEDGVFELITAWKTLGGFTLAEEAYMFKVGKIPKETIMQNATYYCKLFRYLGRFYLNLGLMEAAKKIFETLIKQLELSFGESHGTIVYSAFGQSWKYRCKHPDVIEALHELGTVYSKLGELEKATSVYQDAINRQNKIENPSQELQLCQGLLGMSTVYIQKDNMTEAKKLMTRALELASTVLGEKHHFVSTIFTRLGQLSYKQGRIDEALSYYLQDLKVTRSQVGTNHPRTAVVLNEIGLVYDDKNDVLAGQLYEAALSIILDTYGNHYLGTGAIRYNLGAFYFGTNHFAKAKYQFTESYKIHIMFLGEDHRDTIAVKEALDIVSSMTTECATNSTSEGETEVKQETSKE